MDSHYLLLLAHFLVGSYFVFFGFWNIYHWTPILKVMGEKGIPLPFLSLQIGIFLQIVTGTMLALGIYTKLAALLLIPFTLFAIFMFHPFWRHRGELFTLNFTIFAANITVTIGALLLIIAS